MPLPRGTLYLGLDPGASGGLACVAVDHRGRTNGVRLQAAGPLTLHDLWEWVRTKAPSPIASSFAVLEKVGGFVKGNPLVGSAMFNFGASYGGVRMALVAAGIPFEEITPQVWQRKIGVPPRDRNESKTNFKRRLKETAQKLFPAEHVTLATCDALLIAEFCRRKREGKL